jgi:ABC-type phosphate transport system substrate-binding protein
MRSLTIRVVCGALVIAAAGTYGSARGAEGLVVIAHPNVPKLDVATLERIYTGKDILVNNVAVVAVNAKKENPNRARFLETFLKEPDDKYTLYWLVRTHSGLGSSPREMTSSAAIVEFVKATPGAIGYVDEADVTPGVNVLLRNP